MAFNPYMSPGAMGIPGADPYGAGSPFAGSPDIMAAAGGQQMNSMTRLMMSLARRGFPMPGGGMFPGMAGGGMFPGAAGGGMFPGAPGGGMFPGAAGGGMFPGMAPGFGFPGGGQPLFELPVGR